MLIRRLEEVREQLLEHGDERDGSHVAASVTSDEWQQRTERGFLGGPPCCGWSFEFFLTL